MRKFVFGLIVGLLLPAVGGYFYIKAGKMPVATASAPLPMEEKIAHMALSARMKKEMPKNSPVAADETNMTQGAHIYRRIARSAMAIRSSRPATQRKACSRCRRNC